MASPLPYHTISPDDPFASEVSITGYDLSNGLHGLFQREAFLEARHEASTHSFLGKLKRFHTATIMARRRHTLPVYPKKAASTLLTSKKTRADLLRMAGLVRFDRRSFEATEMMGLCSGGADRLLPGVPPPLSCDGTWCKIEYSEVLYQELCQLHDDHTKSRETVFSPQLYRSYFCFATLLLHELGHAAWHSVGAHSDEVNLGDCPIAEMGFEMEARNFRGCEIMPGLDEDGSLVMLEWPSASIWTSYMHGNIIDAFGKAPATGTVWQIPDAFVKQLFQEEFWTTVVPKLGAEALKVPKLVCLRLIIQPCICRTYYDENVEYRKDENGEDIGHPIERPNCQAGRSTVYVPTALEVQDREVHPAGSQGALGTAVFSSLSFRRLRICHLPR